MASWPARWYDFFSMSKRGWSCATIAFVLAVLGGACSLAIDTSDLSRAAPPSTEGGAPPARSDADAVGTLEDAGVEDAGVGDAGVDDCATADLMTNPRHCGRCGRDCAGGQCMGGRCTPVVLLRDLGDAVLGVALAGDAVYVGAHDEIWRVGVDGGGAVAVAGPTRAHYMAASATHLYWTDGSAVLRWPLEGGPIRRIVSDVPFATGVALGPNHVYFSSYTMNGGVERALLDGGSRETVIAPYNKPEDIDFANGELFVGGDGENELAAFASDGFGSKRVLSRDEAPVAMAVWGSDVFFVQQGDNTVRRMPIDGGSVEWLADSDELPTGIAVNADSVFWVTYSANGKLYRLVR
jgi:hypothetical protein